MSEDMKPECQKDAENKTGDRIALSTSQSLHSAPFIGLRNTLPSDIDIISSIVDQLMNFTSRFRAAGGNFEIELALREALVNAVVHGNQKQSQKRVYVNCRCKSNGEVSITVEE